MKRSFFVLVLVAGLIGGGIWYGLHRGAELGGPSPETSQKIMLAEQFVTNGEPTRALAVIDELSTQGMKVGEAGEWVRVQALGMAGRHEAAAQSAAEFLARYPQSPKALEARAVQLSADLARSGFTNPGLRKSVEEFTQQHPDHPASAKLEVSLAEQDLSLGDFAAARRRLDAALQRTQDDEQTFRLAKALGDANVAKLKSNTPSPNDKEHVVARGDTINGIARRHNLTEELLMAANEISNPKALRVGQKLRVPDVDFSLHVDVAANTMELKNHGEFFKLYRVRTGRVAGATPEGTFKVLNKKRAPTWRPGNGFVYGPNDPNNELGTRWMAFEGDILGIHGTLHPETIGHYASNGCVGLTTADVEELFDLITVGTPLTIKGQQDLNRHKVIPAPPVPPPMEVASK